MKEREENSYEKLLDILNERGYTLHTEGYVGYRDKIEVSCEKRHNKYITNAESIKKNSGYCPACKIENIILKRKKDVEGVGYTYYDTGYVKGDDRVKVSCEKGHEPYFVKIGNFRLGRRCKACMKEKFSSERMLDYKVVKQYIKDNGYTMLSKTYLGALKKFDVECPKGHKMKTSWTMFKHNENRCPRCKSSRGENIIRYILDNYGVDYINGFNVTINSRLHIFDFYLPNYNIYIEHQGNNTS